MLVEKILDKSADEITEVCCVWLYLAYSLVFCADLEGVPQD